MKCYKTNCSSNVVLFFCKSDACSVCERVSGLKVNGYMHKFQNTTILETV